MVLDNVFRVGELLVDGIVSDCRTDGVVLAVAYVIDFAVVDWRAIPEKMIDNFAVLLFLEQFRQIRIRNQRVHHCLEHDFKITNKNIVANVFLFLNAGSLEEKCTTQLPQSYIFV